MSFLLRRTFCPSLTHHQSFPNHQRAITALFALTSSTTISIAAFRPGHSRNRGDVHLLHAKPVISKLQCVFARARGEAAPPAQLLIDREKFPSSPARPPCRPPTHRQSPLHRVPVHTIIRSRTAKRGILSEDFDRHHVDVSGPSRHGGCPPCQRWCWPSERAARADPRRVRIKRQADRDL